MAKKYAFLFPGQGAQSQGMIKDIVENYSEAKKILSDISDIAHLDVTKLMWESDALTLSRSDNSQIAITSASIVIAEILKSKGITPSAAMGFSLGEFPALYASGVLSFEDVIKVVRQRGLIMQEVCEQIAQENSGHAPGMTAVLGLVPEKVVEIASKIKDAYAANMNSQKQTVVSGTFDALTQLEEEAVKEGARRVVRLKVAGPFHSPLMQRAADRFQDVLSEVQFNDPNIHLFSNVTGKEVKSGEAAKNAAVLHLVRPVLWTSEESVLAEIIKTDSEGENSWEILETGPGKVLSGLWAQTELGADFEAKPVNNAESLAAFN